MAEATGARKYKMPNNPKELNADEFQALLKKHEDTLPTLISSFALPKVAGKNDYEGIYVYKCLGAYRGDEYCMKCPLRKNCISGR